MLARTVLEEKNDDRACISVRAELCTSILHHQPDLTCSFTQMVTQIKHKLKFIPLLSCPLLAEPLLRIHS